MNIDLGEYDTEDEAAYAYNVGMRLMNPYVSVDELNHGMKLTQEQMDKVEKMESLFILDYLMTKY